MPEKTPDTPDTLEDLRQRIAKLEGENKTLRDVAPVPAPQGQDTTPKNPTETLVQLTRSGNVRTTIDPSLEFVADQAGLYGDAALAEAHDEDKEPAS